MATKKKVAIIAPSSKGNFPDASLKFAISELTANGFDPIYYPDIFDNNNLPFIASSAEIRTSHLKRILEDDSIDIIWPIRGGYGAIEIIHQCMKFKRLAQKHHKILIGYSDTTNLHFLFNQHYELPSIHGPGLSSFEHHQQDAMPEIIDLLSGKESILELISLDRKNQYDIINAITCGGNLSVMCKMIGSKLQPDFAGKIIFIEDVNESPARIYTSLMQIYNASMFTRAKAVIFGDFVEQGSNGKSSIISGIYKIINAFCKKYIPNTPCFIAEGVGHGDKNHPFILGKPATIRGNDNSYQLVVEGL